MRTPKNRLPVIYADDALRDIDEIADWNKKTYGPSHAKEYIQFLTKTVDGLTRDFGKGRRVGSRPEFRFISIQKRNKGHGHIAVYTVDDQAVTVVHVFHSSQDWESKIEE